MGGFRHQGSRRRRGGGSAASACDAGGVGAASGGRCPGGAVTDDSTARSTRDRLVHAPYAERMRIVLAVVAAALALPAPAAAVDDGLARTPPMGWSSWNRFGCGIDEHTVRETADEAVRSGRREAGYRYVNVDDCWMAAGRDGSGRLRADPQSFPSGIPALADYVHARGLRLGLYTSIGEYTCQG